MNIQVKQAVPGSLNEAAELFNQYRLFYGQRSDLEGARAFLYERLALRESVIFLAMDIDRNVPAGFMQLYPTFSSISMQRSWILNDLFVAEAYRRQGIAQLLLDQAKDYVSSVNAKGLELSTAVTNVQAQRLYERNGFVKDDEYVHYNLLVTPAKEKP